jgi:hypothetical protein
VAGLSRAWSFSSCRLFNFKTPRHATASTTMLHFGVYVAVPRGKKTDFDVMRLGAGLFTMWLRVVVILCYQPKFTRALSISRSENVSHRNECYLKVSS